LERDLKRKKTRENYKNKERETEVPVIETPTIFGRLITSSGNSPKKE